MMKSPFNWWYRLSIPTLPTQTPDEREKSRYARLTAGFLLILFLLAIPGTVMMIFFSPASPSSPPIGISLICLLLLSWLCGRFGLQRLSAILILIYIFVSITGPLVTNPFDGSLFPLFSTYSIAVILAGALLPPVATLVTGAMTSIAILAIVGWTYQVGGLSHMNEGNQLHLNTLNIFSIVVFTPVSLQILIAIIMYVIMRNLLFAIRRADRAEEIIVLQQEIAAHERTRLQEKEALEESFLKIAEAHARIANGDFSVRVSLSENDPLSSVANSLNTLLTRLQRWKGEADQLQQTRIAAEQIARQLRQQLQVHQVQPVAMTRTALDPVLAEMNRLFTAIASRP